MNKQIILLNGPSSAGKSSISRALKTLLSERGKNVQIISIDDFLNMSPEEPIWEDDVFEITPNMVNVVVAAQKEEKVVIIDHVITSARIFEAFVEHFEHVLKVFVTCSIEVLRQREAARGDRYVGSAEASLQYLYPQEGYDVIVDTSDISELQGATFILEKF